MHSCDVLIVGGGPAGSSCAWALRASGLHVVVLDKSIFPRDKLCGGWITPFVLQSLEISSEDYARERTFQPISGFRVGCMGQDEVAVQYDRIVSYGIRRCEFDEYLLRRSGAHIREGAPLAGIERQGDSWIINGEIRTRLLIGAGGHFCPVSRFIGNSHAAQPVLAQEIEFAMDDQQAAACNIASDVPELYFCRDLLGYGWCFRKGKFLNVGLGRLDRHALPEHVSRFLELLRASGKMTLDLPNRLSGHAYLLFGHSPRKLVDDFVMLVGDAAGLAYAESGEGIRPAIESGLLAAKVIQSLDGKYTRDRLERYPALLTARFSNGRAPGETLARVLPRNLRNRVARLLLSKEWFCRSVVVDNWFLHARDRALL